MMIVKVVYVGEIRDLDVYNFTNL